MVVLTEELAEIVKGWVQRYDGENPSEVGYRLAKKKKGEGAVARFTAREYIRFHSGVSERNLARILARETRYTSLSQADQILIAIERQEVLPFGEVRVFKDPRVRRGARYQAVMKLPGEGVTTRGG